MCLVLSYGGTIEETVNSGISSGAESLGPTAKIKLRAIVMSQAAVAAAQT
jgi:hypothetical protein